MSLAPDLAEIEYPDSDGKPMGETDVHRAWMIRLCDQLKYYYRGQRVYVASDLLLYYTEGVPFEYVVPDEFVVLDCDPGPRRTFQTWVEKRVPNLVIEVTSRWTKKEDRSIKPSTYAHIGVRELFLFDPTGDYLRPALQGFRLKGKRYRPIEPDAAGNVLSSELGLLFRLDEKRLVLADAATGSILLTEAEAEREGRNKERRARLKARKALQEEHKAREEERKAREAAEQRAAAAEAELARLREELRRRGMEVREPNGKRPRKPRRRDG